MSEYPLTSDVKVEVNVRGTWMVTDNVDGNREWEEEFDPFKLTFTLEKGNYDFSPKTFVGF